MLKRTLGRCLAVCAFALVMGESCYTAYTLGQRHGAGRPGDADQPAKQNIQQVAQHSKATGITLRAEHDEDGPYIVVVIPWRTLCASGLKLPQEQAEDCADAKASKSPEVTYILPTDDDNDDDSGPTNRETTLRVSSGQLPLVSASCQRSSACSSCRTEHRWAHIKGQKLGAVAGFGPSVPPEVPRHLVGAC